MYKNDLILIDRIIEEEKNAYSGETNDGYFFDIFSINQVLKNRDLSSDEIEDGITDGKDDGGFDGFYIFANGILVDDPDDIPTMKTDTLLEIIIITSKHADTFQQDVINSEFSTVDDLFDLSKNDEDLICSYNELILEKRYVFKTFYINNISKINNVKFSFYYVSRGDETIIGENILPKSEQIISKMENLINGCKCNYAFVGASQLLNLHNKSKTFHLQLPFTQNFSANEKKYVILCTISDYFRFITDDEGNIKTYLFDSNVRDFNGFNKTNQDIMSSLSDENGPDFWLLNNGITIISSNAVNVGSCIDIENVQIVNGLQTSFTIFEYMKNKAVASDDRKVLIKIITETDPEVKNSIIRATNNQTSIQEQSLHATDKIQMDIEKMLLDYDIYYDRKKNYYKNRGKDISKIISPLYLASGYFSLVLRGIRTGIILRQRFMSDEEAYKKVFEKTNIQLWPKIAKILLTADYALKTMPLQDSFSTNSENRTKVIRHIASFIALSKFFGTFNYTESNIISLSTNDIDSFDFAGIINFLFQIEPIFEKKKWRTKEQIEKFVEEASRYFGIQDLPSFKNRKSNFYDNAENVERTKRLYKKIKNFIPKQPWPDNIHKQISKMTGIKAHFIFEAIKYGIEINDFYVQRDGILYDKNGNEIIVVDKQ